MQDHEAIDRRGAKIVASLTCWENHRLRLFNGRLVYVRHLPLLI